MCNQSDRGASLNRKLILREMSNACKMYELALPGCFSWICLSKPRLAQPYLDVRSVLTNSKFNISKRISKSRIMACST